MKMEDMLESKKFGGPFIVVLPERTREKIDMKYDRYAVFVHKTFELRVFILCIS